MSKQNNKELLPTHHMDNFHIEELKGLSDSDMKPLLKDLLAWVKNMHLPVTREVVEVLSTRADILEDDLLSLLENEKTDTVLKYNIIAYLIAKFPKKNQLAYEKTLERIADKPNKYEKYSEVDNIAKEVLSNF